MVIGRNKFNQKDWKNLIECAWSDKVRSKKKKEKWLDKSNQGGVEMIGIYRITNKLNNKSYIGQSVHCGKRLDEHSKGTQLGRMKSDQNNSNRRD